MDFGCIKWEIGRGFIFVLFFMVYCNVSVLLVNLFVFEFCIFVFGFLKRKFLFGNLIGFLWKVIWIVGLFDCVMGFYIFYLINIVWICFFVMFWDNFFFFFDILWLIIYFKVKRIVYIGLFIILFSFILFLTIRYVEVLLVLVRDFWEEWNFLFFWRFGLFCGFRVLVVLL